MSKTTTITRQELRKSKGLTLMQLATKVPTSISTIQDYERGDDMLVSTLEKIAAALGVTLSEARDATPNK